MLNDYIAVKIISITRSKWPDKRSAENSEQILFLKTNKKTTTI